MRSLTVMEIAIHATFLPHDDPDASPAFWRAALGFEVRNPDRDHGATRRDLEGTTRAAKKALSDARLRRADD